MIIEELKELFRNNGVSKGEILCIHSDITSFGIPQVLKEKIKENGLNYLLDSYIETFKEIVGEEGLIIMPTFSYSASKEEIFDVENTPSTVGVLTEHFRKQKNVYRSTHPIFSFAAWGKNAKDFLTLDNYDCYGEKSFFGKLYNLNITYVMFGADIQHGATCVYYSEEKAKVNYRYYKNFLGIIKTPETQFNKNVRYFVRDLTINYKDYWYDLEKIALEKNLAKIFKFSGGTITLIKSQDIDAVIQEEIKKNKDFLIKRC